MLTGNFGIFMKHDVLIFAVMTAVIVSGCSSDGDGGNDGGKPNEIAVTPEQKVVVESYADFSFDLLDEVVGMAEDGKNIIISPWGAANILSMLANGADADTRADILELESADIEAVNSTNKYLYDNLSSLTSKVQMSDSRALWTNAGYRIFDSFISPIEDYYYAVHKDFSNPVQLKRDIDDWAKSKSNGLIPALDVEVDNNTVFFLADMIYFKGMWREKFDRKDSKPGKFNNADGSVSDVTMMNNELTACFSSTDEYDCLKLDFAKGEYSMLVVLPAAGTDVRSLTRNLDVDDFDTSVAAGKFGWYEVPVTMPRFEADCKLNIDEVFAAMGLKSGWTGIAEGLNGAGIGALYIYQASRIAVDEEGATAATVTYTGMDTAVMFPHAEPFVVDRPFIYLLRENSTGVMLQMGVIERL